MEKITLGISSCPNDIFAFHAILTGKISTAPYSFEILINDVQELNELILAQKLDCSKVSFVTAFRVAETYEILSSGSAIGEGVGPIVVTKQLSLEITEDSKIICPGELTTAFMLFKKLFPDTKQISHRIFSEIMPAVQNNEADFGVVIHEGRFSYQNYHLHQKYDLGELWKERTGNNLLPLGGIVCRKSLGRNNLDAINQIIKTSIIYAFENRTETYATMKQYAQELDEASIWSHVDLYVNVRTIDMGEKGRIVIEEFSRC